MLNANIHIKQDVIYSTYTYVHREDSFFTRICQKLIDFK